jgi:hypothetical protein
MTTTLRSTVHAKLGWIWRDRLGASLVIDSNKLESKNDLADGPGAGQADAVWHAEDQALAAGQSVSFELDALEQSLFGGAITIRLSRVKALLIVNRNASGAGCLQVGGAAVDEWHEPFGAPGDTVKVMPGSPLLLSNCRDGWEVNLQNAVLKVAPVDGDVTFDIAVLGTVSGTGGSSSSSSGS